MKRSLIIMSVIFIGGCAPFVPMEKGLTELRGKHISEAIRVIGSPPETQDLDCGKAYVWSTARNTVSFVPIPVCVAGGFVYVPIPIPVHYECHIEIVTDTYGYIEAWHFDGNVGGCTPWINRFKEYSAQDPE
jgi:hypothetical protein